MVILKGGDMKKETLCWGCQNYAKCSWAKGVPVEGWDATPTTFIDKYGNAADNGIIEVHSYIVNKCPQYIPDTIRKTTIKEIASLVGCYWRTIHRWFKDSEKSKKVIAALKDKGYLLRVYDGDEAYYLEKIDAATK